MFYVIASKPFSVPPLELTSDTLDHLQWTFTSILESMFCFCVGSRLTGAGVVSKCHVFLSYCEVYMKQCLGIYLLMHGVVSRRSSSLITRLLQNWGEIREIFRQLIANHGLMF